MLLSDDYVLCLQVLGVFVYEGMSCFQASGSQCDVPSTGALLKAGRRVEETVSRAGLLVKGGLLGDQVIHQDNRGSCLRGC